MKEIFNWAWNHPSDAGWALFAALTMLTGAFTAAEQKLADFVAKSKGDSDNKAFKLLASAVHSIAYVLRLIRLFAPAAVTRGRKMAPLPPSIHPPPIAPPADATPVTSPQTPSAISDKPAP